MSASARQRVQLPRTQHPMRTVSLRNLAAHKVRLLLTAISVVLGTAFVAGSFIFTDTLNHSFDQIFSTADRGIDARVQARTSYDPGVPLTLVDTIKHVPGVRVVQPVINAPAVLIGTNGKRVDSGGAPSQAGNWVPADESVRPADGFVSGRAPSAPGEIALNDGAAKKAHLVAGDHVRVVLPNAGTIPVTIAGVYKADVNTGGYIGIKFTEQQALALLTDGTRLSSVDVAAQPGVSEQALTARIASVLPPQLKVRSGTQVRQDDQSAIRTALGFVSYVLLGIGFVALIVGTFIIYNTFSMIVAQRLRELALLRAVGADRGQVRRSVLGEAAAVGVLGSVLGLGAGLALAFGLHALLDALNLGLPSGGLVLSTRTVLITLIAGIAVTILSANAPARRAGSVPPVAAMRDEFASAPQASLRRRSAIGAVLALAGVLATVDGVMTKSAGSAAALVGLGLLGVAVGIMCAAPVLANWIITPLGRVLGRPFGEIGKLARTNAVRNPRRTAATSFALTVGLLLVAGVAVIGASFKASINHLFDTHVKADYVVTTQVEVNVPLQAAEKVASLPGVASLTQLHDTPVTIDGKGQDGTAVDGLLAPVFALQTERGSAEPGDGQMTISDTQSKKAGWGLGSRHVLTNRRGASVGETVTGIYKDDQLLGPWLVNGTAYRALVPINQQADIVALVKAQPGASGLQQRIEAVTDPYFVIDVQTKKQYEGTIASKVNGLLGLLYGLLGLSIVIAVLGIVNTLALSVIERRREIGMLRAVGMQRRQVRRALYLESMLIAVFGAVLGLAMGLTFGALFARTLRSQGLDVISVPWVQAIVFLVVAAIVGVLAALWPGVRAARTRPLDAIATP